MNGLSGFPEYLPTQQQQFEEWKKIIATHFEGFGFVALETPAVERLSTLLSKGEDHEIYVLTRYGGKQDAEEALCNALGLRFDLTVPMARYVAQHSGSLVFPYRRYQVAPVWRGERPQGGRYRQFYQCDLDVVGQMKLSPLYNSEVVFVMHQLLERLSIPTTLGPVLWRINHRGVLLAWVKYGGIQDVNAALRLIDKKGKVPFERILFELQQLGASSEACTILQDWTTLLQSWKDQVAVVRSLQPLLDSECSQEFSANLEAVISMMNTLELMGMPESSLQFDPLLARGLAYYSGITYEAVLAESPFIGSICGGGRYDHLTQTLSGKRTTQPIFPGVGVSLGLSRLFSLVMANATPVSRGREVLIVPEKHLADSSVLSCLFSLSQKLREAGVGTEIYLEPHSLAQALKYAHRKSFSFAVLMEQTTEGGDPLDSVQIKNMITGYQQKVALQEVVAYVQQGLSVLPIEHP